MHSESVGSDVGSIDRFIESEMIIELGKAADETRKILS